MKLPRVQPNDLAYAVRLILTAFDNGLTITDNFTDGKLESHLKLTVPADYADDTAAAVGGVVVGEVYRTGSVLKVRVT